MNTKAEVENNFRVIIGEKIILTSYTNYDLKLIKKWFNDEEVMEYFTPSNCNNFYFSYFIRIVKPVLVTKLFKYFKKNGFVYIIQFNNKPIGFVIFWLIDKKERVFRIPIVIGEKKYWGNGLGKDTIETAKELIFNKLDGKIILAGDVSEENKRSINLFLSCGFNYLSDSKADYYRILSIHRKIKKRNVNPKRRTNSVSLILKKVI